MVWYVLLFQNQQTRSHHLSCVSCGSIAHHTLDLVPVLCLTGCFSCTPSV
jgi:Fe2+ or Zn2+ uptake regulation protein